jgi:hypothetical protein
MKKLLTALCLTTGLTSIITAAPSIDDLGISKKSARLHAVQPKAIAKKLKAKKRVKASRKLKASEDTSNVSKLLKYIKGGVRAASDYDRDVRRAALRDGSFITGYFKNSQDPTSVTGGGFFSKMMKPLLNLGNMSTEICAFMGYGGFGKTLPTITAGTNDLAGITTRLSTLEAAPPATGVTLAQVNTAIGTATAGFTPLLPLVPIVTNINTVSVLAPNTTNLNTLGALTSQQISALTQLAAAIALAPSGQYKIDIASASGVVTIGLVV